MKLLGMVGRTCLILLSDYGKPIGLVVLAGCVAILQNA